MRALTAWLTALLLLASSGRAAAQDAGWTRLDFAGEDAGATYALRYVPTSVRPCDPLPVVLFFHGAGGRPEGYQALVQGPAEELGILFVLPASVGSAGWSDADAPTVAWVHRTLAAQGLGDPTRTYYSGHSAGAALAYEVGYRITPGIAALFTLAAPHYPVPDLVEPTYRAPIRMYYGADDPNYTRGSAAANEATWDGLGIPWELDLQAGYGHSTWPDASVRAGFAFLLAHRYPGAVPPSRCPATDGGPLADTSPDAPSTLDASSRLDASSGDSTAVALEVGPSDASVAADAGLPRSGGCACGAVGAPRGGGLGGLLALLAAGCFERRRRPGSLPR